VLLKKGFDPAVEDFKRFFDVIDGKTAIVLINSLPEPYQKIMKMKYIKDLSIAEMSLITGQSRNVIAVQAHRGLEKLKVLYRSMLGKKS
jgi:DNA-directed RNA polymerase specialized sigma24 family protein